MSVLLPPNYTNITHNICINTLQILHCILSQNGTLRILTIFVAWGFWCVVGWLYSLHTSPATLEQLSNGETLRSPEQHNYDKDLASWGIWTPPGDLSWCSPLESLYAQMNLLMNTSQAPIGFLWILPNVFCFRTPTADLSPHCFNRIIIAGRWGICVSPTHHWFSSASE